MFRHTTEFKSSCFLMLFSLGYCEELGSEAPLGTETRQSWAVGVRVDSLRAPRACFECSRSRVYSLYR